MIQRLTTAALILLVIAAPVRAELPAGFDWDDDSVRALAREHPDALDAANPDERARLVGILLGGSRGDRADALSVLERANDLDRWKTFRELDRTDRTDMRSIYNGLDASGQAELLQLAQASGKAATAAGLQQVGIISDNDDTAFPTEYTPDGTTGYKGAADFYKLVGFGTDGRGDPANVHYVSARIPALFVDSRARLAAAGLPDGTFDGDNSVTRFLFGGLDGIEASKIENIDLWMKLHPGQRFVLLGDSLQRDPEVYRWALENHPDQVELVMIHKAGGPARDAGAYRGEVFFDDYVQAQQIVRDYGIPQPGARLPDHEIDASTLPLPDTDVSALTAEESKAGILTKVKDFFEENAGPLARAAGRGIAKPVERAFDSVKSTISGWFHHDKPAEPKVAEGTNRDGVTDAIRARGDGGADTTPSGIGIRGALEEHMNGDAHPEGR